MMEMGIDLNRLVYSLLSYLPKKVIIMSKLFHARVIPACGERTTAGSGETNNQCVP